MKRILWFLPILLMMTFFTSHISAQTFYVAATGSDTAAGSANDPFLTLEKALHTASDGDTVLLMGDISLPEEVELPQTGRITIAGADESACLLLPKQLYLNGDITFENITMHSTSRAAIFCQGHNVTFGEGITTTVASSSAVYPHIYGGTYGGKSGVSFKTMVYKNYTLTVKSGTWYHLHGGSLRDDDGQPVGTVGDLTVRITGGSFTSTQDDDSTNAVIALTGMDALHGDATLEISGGSFQCGVVGLGRPGYNATVSNNAYAVGNIKIAVSGGDFTRGHIGMAQNPIISSLDGNFTLTVTGGNFGNAFSGFDATSVGGIAIADVPYTLRTSKTFTAFDDNLYVSANGDDQNDGLSPETARATASPSGGILHIVGEINASAINLNKTKKPITVTGGNLCLSGEWTAGSNLTLEAITLSGDGALNAGGHNLTVESTVTVSGSIAVNGGTGGSRVLNLRGGSFTTVRGGKVTAGATVYTVIDGATVTGNVVGAEWTRSAILLHSGSVNGNLYAFSAGGNSGAIHLYGGNLGGKVVDSGSGSVDRFYVYIAPAFANTPTVVATKTVNRMPVEDAVFLGGDAYGATVLTDLAAATATGKTAVLRAPLSVGDLTLSASGSGTTVTSVFMGVNYTELAGAKLSLSGTIRCAEATEFRNLTIEAFTNSAAISAEGNPLTIGEGVECSLFRNKRIESYPTLCGGRYQSGTNLSASPNLSIASGTWGIVSGGSYHASAAPGRVQLTGDVTVTVSGGKICDGLYLAGRDTLTGNAVLTVTGGEMDCSVFGAADASTVSGTITVNLYGGSLRGDLGRAKDRAAVGSSFTLNIDGADLDRVNKINLGGGDLNLCTSIDLDAEIVGEATFQNPIAGYADPSVVFADGWYYYTYTKSYAGGQGIYMAKAANLYDIGNVEPQLIWSQTLSEEAAEMTALWAPQLYKLTDEDGVERWYIYAAAQTSTDENTSAHYRLPYIWVGQEDDPAGGYTFFGCMENIDDEVFSYLSQRYLYYGDKLYMFCSGFYSEDDIAPHIQRTRVCEMASPTKMQSNQIVISSPSCDYEYSGSATAGIQEGPFPLIAPNGKLYLLFAAGHTRTDYYCTGILTFTGDETDSLLDPDLWEKSDTAFHFANMADGVYSPGAMIVTTSPDGEHTYAVYHAKNYHLSAYTMRRMYMQEIFFDADGAPYIDPPQSVDTVFTAPLNSLPLSARIEGVGTYGHTDSFAETTPAVAPTCEAEGRTAVETCTLCGAIHNSESIPALGHDPVLTEAEISPSYEADGRTAVYTCSRCNDTYGGEAIPKLLLTPGSGDVDLDGRLSIHDVLLALKILVNGGFHAQADIDFSGKVEMRDILRLLKRLPEA